MNTMAPKLIVEMCQHTMTERWWFRVEDEEGKSVHFGEERLTKLDAIADRTAAVRDYAEGGATKDPYIRCVRRGVYVTRDDPRYRR